MSRATLILANDAVRERAAKWVKSAPPQTRVTFQEPKRTLDQSAKMWADLTEIARSLPWHGVRLSAEDYKLLFMDALSREMRLVPNLTGDGFVNLGRSSSNLSKQEMSELIELIEAFAAEHGVELGT